jgi:HEAT repeat protein
VCLPAAAQAPNAVVEFYEALPQRYVGTDLPADELVAVHQQLTEMQADDAGAVLPLLLALLSHGEEYVRAQAAFGLVVVSARPDGNALLVPVLSRPEVSVRLAAMALSPVRRESGIAALVIERVPVRTNALLDPLLAAIGREDLEPIQQVLALSILVHKVPTRADVLAAVEAFVTRPFDDDVRAAVLGALALSTIDSEALRVFAVRSLGDPDAEVRYQALRLLERMGTDALASAVDRLRALAESTGEPARVGDEARRVLRQIDR